MTESRRRLVAAVTSTTALVLLGFPAAFHLYAWLWGWWCWLGCGRDIAEGTAIVLSITLFCMAWLLVICIWHEVD